MNIAVSSNVKVRGMIPVIKKRGIGLFASPKKNKSLIKSREVVFKNIRRKGGADNFDVSKKSTLVCEFHFPNDEIILRPGSDRKKLKNGIVPSIFEHRETQ